MNKKEQETKQTSVCIHTCTCTNTCTHVYTHTHVRTHHTQPPQSWFWAGQIFLWNVVDTSRTTWLEKIDLSLSQLPVTSWLRVRLNSPFSFFFLEFCLLLTVTINAFSFDIFLRPYLYYFAHPFPPTKPHVSCTPPFDLSLKFVFVQLLLPLVRVYVCVYVVCIQSI